MTADRHGMVDRFMSFTIDGELYLRARDVVASLRAQAATCVETAEQITEQIAQDAGVSAEVLQGVWSGAGEMFRVYADSLELGLIERMTGLSTDREPG